MEIKQTQEEFNSHLNALKVKFSETEENELFKWKDISGILMRTIKKNWTVDSSSSNYQINSENLKDFFPILQISDAFPHWRLSVPCSIAKNVFNSFSENKTSEDWISSNISYRHKIQNKYPYIQLTLENELRDLKNNLKENDQIFFLKDTKSNNYFVFASREKVFSEEAVILTNPALINSDKTQFEVAELTNRESKKAFEFNNVIYYGAPGTGKSYKIDGKIENLDDKYFERVTFHPEFDNASFIGGYKPKSVNVRYEDEKGEEYFENEVRYEFVAQSFTCIYERAWKDLENQHYLVIEEINRGNCAEIFGEIFQLLDRTSKYTVSPSKELREYLEDSFQDKNHLGIKNGLKLPPNLCILATMNTSDQSLFPMDSAFKRRWDWEYIRICYDPTDDLGNKNDSYDFQIDIEDGNQYSWIQFIKKVNLNHIKNNRSLGMDKCIGNYFIKPDKDNIISLKPFINKVIFYLWNDVFKDEENRVFEENTSYEDFFPILKDGKEKIKGLFERIELKPNDIGGDKEKTKEPQLDQTIEDPNKTES